MTNFMIRLPLLFTALLIPAFSSAGKDPLKAFPTPEEGMTRHVLRLPEQDDETLFKVQLLIGKTVEVDEANRYFFGGKVERVTIKGWGYSYYILKKLGPMAGTRMAPPPGAPKVKKFVSLGGTPELLRYNSRMPMVIYVPKGVEVQYRVWRARQTTAPVEEG